MNERQEDSFQDYAREKLWQALGCLIAEGPIRRRLDYAFTIYIRLSPQHFPDHLLPKYLRVEALLNKIAREIRGTHPENDNDTLMTDDEALEAANGILGLYVDLKGGITAAPAHNIK